MTRPGIGPKSPEALANTLESLSHHLSLLKTLPKKKTNTSKCKDFQLLIEIGSNYKNWTLNSHFDLCVLVQTNNVNALP